MEEQQLKELRAMEKNVNLAEEEARSSRLTVEELKVSLLLLAVALHCSFRTGLCTGQFGASNASCLTSLLYKTLETRAHMKQTESVDGVE